MQNQQEDAIDILFEQTYNEIVIEENKNIEIFIKDFDKKFNKYLDEKEEDLRDPIERMINQWKIQGIKWKQRRYDILKQNNNKDIGEQMQRMKKEMNEIKQMNEEMMNEIKIIIEQKQEQQNKMMEQYVSNIKDVKELKDYEKQISIGNINKIDDDIKQIQEWEQKNEKYRIEINYYRYNSSLEFKMEVMNMINEMSVNQKVGRIRIKLSYNNPMNEEIIRMMNNNYNNVYSIGVWGYSNSVDNIVHNQIKQLVRQSIVMKFSLQLLGDLKYNNDGLQLMKEYNQIIKQKQHVDYLRYKNSRINKESYSKQESQWLINEVDEIL